MPYADFKTRKAWFSNQYKEGVTSISCFPLRLRQFRNMAEHFGWEQGWAFIFGIQKGDMDRFRRIMNESRIPHIPVGDDCFLMEWAELKRIMEEDFWSILLLIFKDKPNERELHELHLRLKDREFWQEFNRYVFSRLHAFLLCGIHSFDANATLRIPQRPLAHEVWDYLLTSHIISQQLCSHELAGRCASNLPLDRWEGKCLFYWGYAEPEMVYLLLDGVSPNLHKFERDIDFLRNQGYFKQYALPDDLPCVMAGESSCEVRRFGDIRESMIEPIMPIIYDQQRCFFWKVFAKSKGYVFSMQPFRFRHYVDFLQLGRDAQVFYHPRQHTSNSQPMPFWIQAQAREPGMYFIYDFDFRWSDLLREFNFVLTDSRTSVRDVESILGTEEVKPWFSSEDSVPPIERYGGIWDEYCSNIYLEREEDVQHLIAYTVWSLFKERFDHFPNVIPEKSFCMEMLEYLIGIGGAVIIGLSDLLQDGSEYRLSVHNFIPDGESQAGEIPKADRVYVTYSNRNWSVARNPVF